MTYLNTVMEETHFTSYGDLLYSALKRMYVDVWNEISQFIQESAQEDKANA